MQLRRLKSVKLVKIARVKESNGSYIDSSEDIATFKVMIQELVDEVSASIYGADINKTLRIFSLRGELEYYLNQKANNTSDNISKYLIVINNMKYKIQSVKESWVDIQLLGSIGTPQSV